MTIDAAMAQLTTQDASAKDAEAMVDLGELLPCPFCATPNPQSYEEHAGTDHSEWTICCNGDQCDARVSSDGSGTRESAVKTWNTRAPTSPARAVDDAKLLQGALHALRSYQCGNESRVLAEEVADKIEAAVAPSTARAERDGKS
jgi:hypothetical protein